MQDIEAFVDLILAREVNCSAVQIVTHGVGAGEVLAGLAGDATLPAKVSFVTNLAPCVVPTYLTDNSSSKSNTEWRRMLAEKQEPGEAPRELQELVEDDAPKRELRYYSRDQYWARIERYCSWYPANCFNYCDWYPAYCDEFCSRLPQFCIAPAIRDYYALQDVVEKLHINSFYGPDWATQVAAICWKVDYYTCKSFKATVDAGFAEMGVQQLEHMFQMSFTSSFNQYSSTFEADQTVMPIDVTGVTTQNRSFYLRNDSTCDPAINMAVLDTVPGQLGDQTFSATGLTHTKF